MAKAKKRSAGPESTATKRLPSKPAASHSKAASSAAKASTATKSAPPAKSASKPASGGKDLPKGAAKAGNAKASPAKSVIKGSGTAAKSVDGRASPQAHPASPAGNREKHNVKDGGAKGATAKAAPKSGAKLAVAKDASIKGAPLKSVPSKGAPPKGAKSAEPVLKGAAAKLAALKAGAQKAGMKAGGKSGKASADGKKPAVPAAPPRKIQVVQLTTLKPGARGTKASVARQIAAEETDQTQQVATKKRRSAELTKQQLEHFRELLQQRRSRLSHDLSLMQDEALKVTAQDNSSDSVADTGTDNYEQDFTLGLIESEEALAREVDQALLRIDQSAFGVCESCQTPIPLARLEILPFARFCVECQQKKEGQA